VCWSKAEAEAPTAPSSKGAEPMAIDISLPLSAAASTISSDAAVAPLRVSLPSVTTSEGIELGVSHHLELNLGFHNSADDVVMSLPVVLGLSSKPTTAVPRGTLVDLPDGSSTTDGSSADEVDKSTSTLVTLGALLLASVALMYLTLGSADEVETSASTLLKFGGLLLVSVALMYLTRA